MSDVPDIISMQNLSHVLATAICNAESLGPQRSCEKNATNARNIVSEMTIALLKVFFQCF